MKFQPDGAVGANPIQRHDAGRVVVGGTLYETSVLVPATGEVQPWPPARFEALEAAHFEQVLGLAPELVIFGSGARMRFAPPALLRPLIDAGIGVETMDTAAACRTYNVLVAEGRHAVAALLLGD
jgi:uncharacterized protein